MTLPETNELDEEFFKDLDNKQPFITSQANEKWLFLHFVQILILQFFKNYPTSQAAS